MSKVISLPDVLGLATSIERFLANHVIDEGSQIDTGGGMGQRDMWVKVDGHEYFITVAVRGSK